MSEDTAAWSIGKEMAEAICAVQGAVRQLGKSEKNRFDNYDFVSVDKFFAALGPLMAEHGLFLTHVEGDPSLYESKKGALWMKVPFWFVLHHISGGVMGPTRRTVSVPMTGAQSHGSAQSYAIKQFLRGQFLVPTGDRDDPDWLAKDDSLGMRKASEDFTDPENDDLDIGVRGLNLDPDASLAGKARAYAEAIEILLAKAKTQRGLDGVWKRNEKIIERLRESYWPEFNSILEAYEHYGKMLKGEEDES